MANFTVEKRKTAASVIRYRCIVRIKKDQAIVYQESRTFAKLADARTWGKAMVSHPVGIGDSALCSTLFAVHPHV